MSDSGNAQFIEVLSVARARTDLDAHEKRPVVIVTIRPQPDRSWRPHNLGLTIDAAKRLRDDLASLLKTPATFLLVAFVALATGCSAKGVATQRLALRLLPLPGRVLLAIVDSPTKRYGPKVEGAGIHHDPAPEPWDQRHLVGHRPPLHCGAWVTMSLVWRHPRWGA